MLLYTGICWCNSFISIL